MIYVLPVLVACEAVAIMIIEMFGSRKLQAQAFDLDERFLHQPQTKTLLANQGIYNGAFGILILVTILFLGGQNRMLSLIFEMAFIFVVAIYGSLTASKKIILIQGLPAALSLLVLLIAY
ncbi:membrane protein [Bombiscardovia apis]|uniref:Membrane protein n=1 Tax=Bombiscardovia apis TaxID=2932182 RepID=A0ABM8BC47_9BIFI|nr:DUF1304 domain-containing protein [Bombiscardovia apis]BDR54489.1 membrane protein [Bombiscardovia apis]